MVPFISSLAMVATKDSQLLWFLICGFRYEASLHFKYSLESSFVSMHNAANYLKEKRKKRKRKKTAKSNKKGVRRSCNNSFQFYSLVRTNAGTRYPPSTSTLKPSYKVSFSSTHSLVKLS